METQSLFLWGLAAALAAGPGALLGTWSWFSRHAVGWATAAAAGLMLGIGYVLLAAGQARAPAATLLGAFVGLLAIRLADSGPVARAGEAAATARLSAPADTDAGEILASALHSAAEGVAIGAAAGVSDPLARFLLLTFAIHNVSEGAVLGALLTRRGWRAGAASGMAVLARTTQPLVAVSVVYLVAAVPGALPWLLGASFGALLYLIVAELLPQSYRLAGRTAIAVVASIAAGIVALMGGGG
ncbi:MAG: hypothetical protein IPI38_06590 [Gemmatimonadetes bacterium]|jgi:ZIP family zinc transporter|nr:hypothetical protein [Gemmatimonadota bacterium]MBP6668200.1 hypothetical protein [Gemmatimonadales bacterium]MBK7715074.1 hypothetical protein [Gemmatimonadota bacterium]MBK7786256.1 hypothetical protein [Gemmatimonadota bacterium]MBK9065641.1 hypothetical protein [Gemmatimonadota bacterium]